MDDEGSRGAEGTLAGSGSIQLDTNAAFYGKGVFTTIAIQHSQPFLWEKHFRRLSGNLAMIGLPPISEEETFERLMLKIQTEGVVAGRARLTVLDATPSRLWENEPKSEIRVNIVTAGKRTTPARFCVTRSPFPVNSRSPLAGIKSCNYLENLIAIDEALGRGFHEGLRVNEKGFVTSGCMTNIFWFKGNHLYTPSLSTGCLPGTTREYVLENLDCHEVESGIDELSSADAIFLTSAGLGIVEAREFESRQLKPSGHPIIKLWPHHGREP